MFEIGQVCIKTAGRDAGDYCVVVEDVGEDRVLVDGQTRRREVNIKHLEPIVGETVSIDEGASSEDVEDALESLDIDFEE